MSTPCDRVTGPFFSGMMSEPKLTKPPPLLSMPSRRFMVCFGRSLVLPRLFPSVSHKFWDRGIGPLMGSFACGLAIFIEERRKRAEMALYVAPRALYALAEMARPGWLSRGEEGAIWAERIVCGIAVGIVITAARFRPDFLRGVTSVMAWVVKSKSRDWRIATSKA